MQVEHCPDHSTAGDGPYMLKKIALAIIVAMRHHRPMHAQGNHIEGRSGFDLRYNLIAQRFIDVAPHRPAWPGKSAGPFNDLPAFRALCTQRRHGPGRLRRHIRMLTRTPQHSRFKTSPSCGDGRERIGLCA